VLIGAHESIAGGLSQAFGRAKKHRAKSLQIFTRNARGWKSPPLDEQAKNEFVLAAQKTKLPSIAHGSYLVNLGGEDALLRQKSLDCLTDELTRCELLGVEYLVIHPGCHAEELKGIRLIAKALDWVHAQTSGFRSRICLEVTAGQGNAIGWRFEQLAAIFERVRDARRLGLCLDTCHLHAAGYDLTTLEGYDRVMAECDRLLGLQNVKCFHLNDCKKPLGCRVDRHEEIGKGTLGLTPFTCLVNDQRFSKAVAVLETPFPERYGRAIRLLESLVRT
jgi:deoxyribonuclease IV